MARKRGAENRLELWEVAIAKAMLRDGRFNIQDIQAHFTRPGRTINHARIIEIKGGSRHGGVAAAAAEDLDRFLSSYPDVDWSTGLHLISDELLIKAREAMLAAVQGYNSGGYFKTERCIVTSIIAWTYALHYFYGRKDIDHRYRDSDGTLVQTKHGAPKQWDLAQCLAHPHCPLDKPTKANLEFLVELRHEIEHQMTRRIDDTVSAKLQACCLNFNRFLREQFGARSALDHELSFALQFSKMTHDQRNLLLAEKDLPPNVRAMTSAFENTLDDEVASDLRYAYHVVFVEKAVNSKGKADAAIQFTPAASAEGQEIQRVVFKDAEKRKFRPLQVIEIARKAGFKSFNMRDHTLLWKERSARDPEKRFGVFLREDEKQDWWWYQNWVDEVLKYCAQNKVRYGFVETGQEGSA